MTTWLESHRGAFSDYQRQILTSLTKKTSPIQKQSLLEGTSKLA